MIAGFGLSGSWFLGRCWVPAACSVVFSAALVVAVDGRLRQFVAVAFAATTTTVLLPVLVLLLAFDALLRIGPGFVAVTVLLFFSLLLPFFFTAGFPGSVNLVPTTSA